MRTLPLIILTTASLLAQADNWDLLRGIYPGQITHVHTLDGRMHSGGFISTSASNIVIRVRTGDQTFTKDRIEKVSARKSGKRWRNAAIGATVGAAAVGVLLAANDGESASFAAGVIVAYGLMGACIGALFPGYDTLYRAPRK